MTTSVRRGGALLASAAIIAGLAACSSGGKSTAVGHASGGPTRHVSLGTPNPASGKAIVLGMINQEGAATGSFPQLSEAAQAAVQYVNTYRNGIHGRPLKLVTCVGDGTPATAVACMNKLLSNHPVAMAGGSDLGMPAVLPILDKSGLAYIGGTPQQHPELTDPNSVHFVGFGVGAYPGLAAYTADVLKAKKVSVIYPSGSVGKQILDAFILSVLSARRVTDVKIFPVDPATPDLTPTMAAAMASGPDAVIGFVAPSACVSMMQAHSNLGSNAKLLLPGVCDDPSVLRAAGAAANGTYFNGDFDPPGASTADAELFNAVLQRYAPRDIPLNEFTQVGFNDIMNIWRVFNQIPNGALTTSNILRQFRTGSDQPNFMAKPYTCDGKQVPGAPAVCNAAQRILRVRDGKAVQVSEQWYDGAQYLAG